jgi:hypothetical protein
MDVMGTTVEEALGKLDEIYGDGCYDSGAFCNCRERIQEALPTIRAELTRLRSKVADLETVVNLQEGLLASYRRERERGKDDGYDEDDRERG